MLKRMYLVAGLLGDFVENCALLSQFHIFHIFVNLNFTWCRNVEARMMEECRLARRCDGEVLRTIPGRGRAFVWTSKELPIESSWASAG